MIWFPAFFLFFFSPFSSFIGFDALMLQVFRNRSESLCLLYPTDIFFAFFLEIAPWGSEPIYVDDHPGGFYQVSFQNKALSGISFLFLNITLGNAKVVTRHG